MTENITKEELLKELEKKKRMEKIKMKKEAKILCKETLSIASLLKIKTMDYDEFFGCQYSSLYISTLSLSSAQKANKKAFELFKKRLKTDAIFKSLFEKLIGVSNKKTE